MNSCALGLDVGDRRVGVALSDPDGLIALPLTTIQERDQESAIRAIVGLIETHNVGRVVVGLPRLMGGEEGEQAGKVRDFAQALSMRITQPIDWWDERLSTVAAEKLLGGGDTRKERDRRESNAREKRTANRDSLAAALFLQAYLDYKRALLT